MEHSLLVLLAVVGALSEPPNCGLRMRAYYQELGCVPMLTPGADPNCSKSYDCSGAYVSEELASQCSYRGVIYEEGSVPTAPDNLLSCLQNCTCVENGPGHPLFICPPQSCARRRRLLPGCVETYSSLDNCCVDKICCHENATATRPMCHYGGKSYELGQKFYPADSPCTVCLCQEGYDGTLNPPWCRQSSCHLETLHRDKIRAGCAPVFDDDVSCCPTSWRCPSLNDRVVQSIPCGNDSSTANEAEPKCYFGALTVHIGEQVSQDDSTCLTCSCEVPPQITCRRLARSKCFRRG